MVCSGKYNVDFRDYDHGYSTPLGLITTRIYIFEDHPDLDPLTVRDYEEKIKFLLQNGADYKEKIDNPFGKFGKDTTDVGEQILRKGTKHMFNLLLNFLGDINDQHGFLGDTALHIAIERGFFKTMKNILARNADVNKPNYEQKETPLHRAVRYNRINFINLLIEHGVSMESTDVEERTPLHYAYSRDIRGWTPMHTLVSRSETATVEASEVIELFLDRAFDLETKNFQGRTPLYLILKKKIGPLALLFLRNGANLEITADDAMFLLPYISSKGIWDYMTRTILKFIALEVSKGTTLHENLKILSERKEASNYLNTCFREIDMLKYMEIENTTVTYWRLLTKGINQIALYAKNYSITEEIRTFEVSSYPIYGPDILYKFAKGKRRLELMTECADKLNRMWEWKLPSVFVDMVIDQLSIADMENLKSV
ncbi:serine/threonine-protein phosphatase 6 regulatory ankyrin repeat subunit C-like [Coccinella septempunctata]|uniref:serine/threonine-protein phosphatase 6 regulatory ankyrin repeat subunit C-like n=1 Tax=Coccinella septempunctata TaxID=41139 RepID=UPI001D08A50C|nr:serine/threonine-protein phosphatase 6 regulatory ankyrin repeat subunit C-like [Coccinella septempunctata]